MKRILAIVLCLTLVFGLCACSTGGSKENQKETARSCYNSLVSAAAVLTSTFDDYTEKKELLDDYLDELGWMSLWPKNYATAIEIPYATVFKAIVELSPQYLGYEPTDDDGASLIFSCLVRDFEIVKQYDTEERAIVAIAVLQKAVLIHNNYDRVDALLASAKADLDFFADNAPDYEYYDELKEFYSACRGINDLIDKGQFSKTSNYSSYCVKINSCIESMKYTLMDD